MPLDTDLHPSLRRLDALAEHLTDDPAVIAVVGVGSAGTETARFDDHSDLDFYVVVEDRAAKDRYVASTAWLAGLGGRVAFAFPNTHDGWKVLLEDGLFLEFATFTADELPGIPLAGERVVRGRPGFAPPPRPVPARDARDTVAHHLDEVLTNLFVGLHRELRGERLAAHRFVQVYAVDHVLALLRLDEATEQPFPDVFEATRRVEQARTDRQPDWAALVRGYAGNAASARAVLDWVERWYDPSPAMVAAIRGLLAR